MPSLSPMLHRGVAVAAMLVVGAAPLLAPSPAKAWYGHHPAHVIPAPIYARPLYRPRVYAMPAYVAPVPPYARVWVPGHWSRWGTWVPAHWR